MRRIVLQPAYVLHRRAYRETSILADIFTPEFGRLSVIANGVRKLKSTTQGILQPFVPLLISCSGTGELLRLNAVELHGVVHRLAGECLYAGLYLNELLMYLLEKWDAHPQLYQIYASALVDLQHHVLDQKVLRLFEKKLLEEIGYGLLPTTVTASKQAFIPDQYYRFVPEQGFFICNEDSMNVVTNVFSGNSLLAIAQDDWREDVLQDAKRLMRLVLTPLLGVKAIHSRKLFKVC